MKVTSKGQLEHSYLLKPIQQRVIVIGDAILDKYVTGRSTRLSPEAPVPIISIDSAPEYRLGGAANVAANIKSLGGNPFLISRINAHGESKEFANLIHENLIDGYLVHTKTALPVKTRILANNQQVARLDYEETAPLTHVEEQIIIQELNTYAQDSCGIVVSDYAKGLLTIRV